MSIVHEALKKAARETSKISGKAERGYFSYSKKVCVSEQIRWTFSAVFCLVAVVLGLFYFDIFPTSVGKLAPMAHRPAEASLSVSESPQKDNAVVKVEEGLSFYRKGELPLAQVAFASAVRMDPEFAVAHNNLGFVLRAQGQLGDAEFHYEEALRIDPQYAEAVHNLGLVYDRQGQMARAMSSFRKALELDPLLAESHFQLATVLERTGNIVGARRQYQNFLKKVKGQSKKRLQPIRQHLQALQSF